MQFLTSVEVVIGVAMLTVSFAAVLAHLGQRFSTLAQDRDADTLGDVVVPRMTVDELAAELADERRLAQARHAELTEELDALRQQRQRPWHWGWWHCLLHQVAQFAT